MTSTDDFASAMRRFADEIATDIDGEHGGVSWWKGQLPKDEAGLLTSYLLSLLSGIEQSMSDASFSIEEFADCQRTWNFTANQKASQGRHLGVGFLASTAGDRVLGRRTHMMRLHSEQCLSSLVTAQDRIGAVALIVIAHDIKRNGVMRTAWQQFATAAEAMRANSGLQTEGKPITEDSEISAALHRLSLIPDSLGDFGPADWLPWMRETRNTHTHRARPLQPVLTEMRGKSLFHYHSVFLRDPEKYYLQSLAARDDPQRKRSRHLLSTVILRDPVDVMNGLRDSTDALLAALLHEFSEVWAARRQSPAVLSQPAGQWPELESEPKLQFEGYGQELNITADTIVINPSDTERLKVAGVFDE